MTLVNSIITELTIYKKYFSLVLKECEFCFNYGTPKNQHKILRKWR